MKVVILCGGKGERLREKTEAIPKPLVEIGDKPILWHIMKLYSYHGFKKFVLCLGYKGGLIKEHFEKNNAENWEIEFVDTGLETKTGGRIKKIQKFIDTDNFLATYGDGISDINIHDLIENHDKNEKIATVTCVNLKSTFGILDIDENNIIRRFNEKPLIDMWINGGFFVFNKKIFDVLDDNSILEEEPMRKLAQIKELNAYKYTGFWECMDTYKDNRVLNEAYKKGQAKWMVWNA